jgi:mannose-6-phosphate isomerase-like protein (cupin superfamily)
MPLLKCSDPMPEWSELDFINIYEINEGEEKFLIQKSPKEKIFLGKGVCDIFIDDSPYRMKRENFFEIEDPGKVIKVKAEDNSTIIHVGGHWSEETGSCGVFQMNNSNNPKNIGDPVDYERTTDFDNHFHDCDEYWIIFKGIGLAVSEGKKYELKTGYVLATKMGNHHDLPNVYEEIHGVWFETSLKGKKRSGHLWSHTHES